MANYCDNCENPVSRLEEFTLVDGERWCLGCMNPYSEQNWCDCENESNETYFVDDNECFVCTKHHYRCAVCDGITQIG